MSWAISRITSSASLSGFLSGIDVSGFWSVKGDLSRPTLMSSRSQISSRPGEAKYSSISFSLGIGSCGALSVRNVLR